MTDSGSARAAGEWQWMWNTCVVGICAAGVRHGGVSDRTAAVTTALKSRPAELTRR